MGERSRHWEEQSGPLPVQAGRGESTQRQASGFLSPGIWRANTRSGKTRYPGPRPPFPAGLSSRPRAVEVYRHGGGALGAWSLARGGSPQPTPAWPCPRAGRQSTGRRKRGRGMTRGWRSFHCAPPAQLDVRLSFFAPYLWTKALKGRILRSLGWGLLKKENS